MPRTHRLFLALWPDDAIRQRIAEHSNSWTLPPGCVRYGPADWHVTLHFLGNVATDRIADVAAGVDVPVRRFELVLDRPQLWPRGLAVVCASAMAPGLQALHGRLGQALGELDQAVEPRPYRPHLTLARRAGAAILPIAPSRIAWPVHGYALVVSTGVPAQRYAVLRQYG